VEEILAAIIQFLFETFGELILQVVVQFAVEVFARFISSIFRGESGPGAPKVPAPSSEEAQATAHPAAIWVLSATLGGVIGCISVWAHPAHFIKMMSHRWLNLVLTPLLSGWFMAALGHWHEKRGHRVVSMDKFFNGWGFALAFAVVRMVWCR
jgi:hypothetical protein